mgnify:CR=1 FL=1
MTGGGLRYDGVCTGLLLLLNLMAVTRHSGIFRKKNIRNLSNGYHLTLESTRYRVKRGVTGGGVWYDERSKSMDISYLTKNSIFILQKSIYIRKNIVY